MPVFQMGEGWHDGEGGNGMCLPLRNISRQICGWVSMMTFNESPVSVSGDYSLVGSVGNPT